MKPERQMSKALPLDSVLFKDGVAMKCCAGCGGLKPITEFYIVPGDPTKQRNLCIVCWNEKQEENRQKKKRIEREWDGQSG